MPRRHHRGVLIVMGGKSYTTLDPAKKSINHGLDPLKLTITHGFGNAWGTTFSVHGKTAGKWYYECGYNATGNVSGTMPGVVHEDSIGSVESYPGFHLQGYATNNNGSNVIQKWNNGVATTLSGSYGNGALVSVLLDLDAGEVTFWDDGIVVPGAPHYTGLAGKFYAGIGLYTSLEAVTVNFGATPFTYTPPAGYSGWLTS